MTERTSAHRPLLIALVLSAGFLVAEFAVAVTGRALVLFADAGHQLIDVAAIALALGAARLANRPATAGKTYGYFRVEVLAALVNGAVLIVVTTVVATGAILRLGNPGHTAGLPVLVTGLAGLVVNGLCTMVLRSGAGRSENLRAAFWHLAADTLGSLAAVVAGALILAFGWQLADPVAALAVSALVLISASRLVRDTVDVLLEATPSGMDLVAVRETLAAEPEVRAVHDLHIWTLASGYVAASAHLVLTPGAVEGPAPSLLVRARERLANDFGIDHTTLQLEHADHPDESVHCDGDPRCLP